LIHHFDNQFPPQLRELDEPPYWLFVEGNVSVLHQHSVAIVGTRKPSEDGMELARLIGGSLRSIQSVVVSGLADGIDQAIHRASLRHGIPNIAVLGTGILSNYPRGSESIRKEICNQGGAIITEYLPDDSYSAQNFVRRNRIQAGLARIVIPVEWKIKSGTAHTVKFAQDTQRKIVCVRRAHWDDKQHPELLYAKGIGAKIYTLPDEEEEFIAAVKVDRGVN
jgi:DNA protecting protein DprA